MNKRDKLLIFNSIFLFNKAEIIASFDDFVAHHQEKNNEEGYSEGRRKVLLALCEQFRNELVNRDIQPLNKNWFYYDYDIKNDSITLFYISAIILNLIMTMRYQAWKCNWSILL